MSDSQNEDRKEASNQTVGNIRGRETGRSEQESLRGLMERRSWWQLYTNIKIKRETKFRTVEKLVQRDRQGR